MVLSTAPHPCAHARCPDTYTRTLCAHPHTQTLTRTTSRTRTPPRSHMLGFKPSDRGGKTGGAGHIQASAAMFDEYYTAMNSAISKARLNELQMELATSMASTCPSLPPPSLPSPPPTFQPAAWLLARRQRNLGVAFSSIWFRASFGRQTASKPGCFCVTRRDRRTYRSRRRRRGSCGRSSRNGWANSRPPRHRCGRRVQGMARAPSSPSQHTRTWPDRPPSADPAFAVCGVGIGVLLAVPRWWPRARARVGAPLLLPPLPPRPSPTTTTHTRTHTHTHHHLINHSHAHAARIY